MLQYEEALARILAAMPAPKPERLTLSNAPGRVLLEPVRSLLDLPPFDNSAMDGYALCAGDLKGASRTAPRSLRVIGRVAAGERPGPELIAGSCVRLFTGSQLPPGADAVVMQEDTRPDPHEPGKVWLETTAEPGENVRCRGEDLRAGAVLADAGQALSAAVLALLAAAGTREVVVGRQPTVALLATGSELKDAGQPLAPGEIYESNRAAVAELTRRAGGAPRIFPLVPDEPATTRAAVAAAFAECDMVVTSGGVSVGELDFVKEAFSACGGQTEFWKVGIKPGRPFVFGRLGEKFLFGLPGNPVSAFVTFLLLVRPAVLRWQGAAEAGLPCHPGTLSEAVVNEGNRRHFMRVTVDDQGGVRSAGVQASHVLSSLARANGLLDVPPQTTLPVGTLVQVLRF